MSFSNIKIDGLTVEKFDALQSPAHYVKEEEGGYVAVKLGCCKCRYLSYHAEKIKRFFNRLGHFLTSGQWENNSTLLKHLHNRVNEINNYHIEIGDDERQALQDIHKGLLARISGQVTQCTLDIFQKISSPDQSVESNIDELSDNARDLQEELKEEKESLEEEKKEIQLKEDEHKETTSELERVLSQEHIELVQPQEFPGLTDRFNDIISKLEQSEIVIEVAQKKEQDLNKQIKKLQQDKDDISKKHSKTKEKSQNMELELQFATQQIEQLYREMQDLKLLRDTTIKVSNIRDQKFREQIEQLKKDKEELGNTQKITVEEARKRETVLAEQIENLQREKLDLDKPNEIVEKMELKELLPREQLTQEQLDLHIQPGEEFADIVNQFRMVSKDISKSFQKAEKKKNELSGRVEILSIEKIEVTKERNEAVEEVNRLQIQHDVDAKKIQELKELLQKQEIELSQQRQGVREREVRIDELQNQIKDLNEPEILHVKPKRELSDAPREAKSSLDSNNFFFIDLLGAEDVSFSNYLKFIAPIAKHSEILTTYHKDSSHRNFKKYVKEANRLFKAGLETAQKKVDILHLQLCNKLENMQLVEPHFSEDGKILICSEKALKVAFDLAINDKDLQRLHMAAFDCDSHGLDIKQKAEFYRLIQQLICGSKECEKRPLPTSPYCFGVAEIFNKTSPLMVDAKETCMSNSYLFTQAMTSNPEIKENHHKFIRIGGQFVKDTCLRGGTEGTCLEINGKKLSFASDAVDEIQKNYTEFLIGLKEEELKTIVKEDSQSPLVKAVLDAFTSGRYEEELKKEARSLDEKLKIAISKDLERLNKQLSQVEKKLKLLQKIKEDCKTSAFPESILQFILQEDLDYWSTSTESGGSQVYKRIENTIKHSGFNNKELVEKLAEKNNCSKEQVEPLIRYKILELICSLNQSVQSTLVIHAKNEINLSFASHPYNSVRKAPTTIRLTGDRYDALSMQFDIGYKNSNSDNYFMMGNLELSIDRCSQGSKARYQVFKDTCFSFAVQPEEIDLVVKKVKTLNEYLDDLSTNIKNDVSNLATINTLTGGGVLFCKNEKFEIDHGFFGTGMVRPFVVPTVEVMQTISDTFKKVRLKFDILDKNLSAEKKKETLKDITQHLNTLEAVQIKLGQVVLKADQRMIAIYESIAEELNEIKMIGYNWSSKDLVKEHIEKNDLTDFVQNADTDFIQQSLERSTSNIKELNQEQTTGYLTDAYAAYWKRFTESTESKDFMWKTEKYDQMIGSMQAFFKDLLPKDLDKEVFKKEGVGQSFGKLCEILAEMKIDPSNRPDDHLTLDYQKRVRNLYQRFFIHLSVASEAAIVYKGSDPDEKKCANAILELCGQFFNGINMKEASQHAVETFYPLVGLKDKGLCKSVKEAYEAIKHADPYKKTPMHHGIWKSLIGHFNVGFNSWLAGNPVSQWFNTIFGNGRKVSLLAFGSPTSESPTSAEVIAPFRAAMKQYAVNGDNHLYVSLQNFIPVKKQNGWKEKILGICPNWIAGAAETILGGDETNRCKALRDFEQSEDGKALYFMALSKNSKFYNKPEKMKDGVDELATAKNYKKELFSQLFTGKPDETGNYISDKIRKDYLGSTNQDLNAWGDTMIEKIHLTLFPDPQNIKQAKANLTTEERKIFTEVLYYFLTNELAQKLPNLKSMNTSCKDDIDRGIAESTKDFGIKGIVNDQESDEIFIQELVTQVFARALFARQREIIEERMEMLLKVIDFTLYNKAAMKDLHVDVWGKTMPTATMV